MTDDKSRDEAVDGDLELSAEDAAAVKGGADTSRYGTRSAPTGTRTAVTAAPAPAPTTAAIKYYGESAASMSTLADKVQSATSGETTVSKDLT